MTRQFLTRWKMIATASFCLCAQRALADDTAGSNDLKELSSKAIQWNRYFGGRKEDPSGVYCLLGQGFFLAPTAKDIGPVIQEWLVQHPQAVATPVCSLQPLMRGQPNSRLVYVWVHDHRAHLNIELVRKGCCPAYTMGVLPKTALSVSKARYRSFVKEAEAAEERAKRDQVGIWNKNRLADPERAIVVAVSAVEVPVGMLTSGQNIHLLDAHVDVSLTKHGKEGKPETKVILEDLPVADMEYATGQSVLTVTLGASPEQAQTFARMKNDGIVRLVLRDQKKR